jgi:hypothetical protein
MHTLKLLFTLSVFSLLSSCCKDDYYNFTENQKTLYNYYKENDTFGFYNTQQQVFIFNIVSKEERFEEVYSGGLVSWVTFGICSESDSYNKYGTIICQRDSNFSQMDSIVIQKIEIHLFGGCSEDDNDIYVNYFHQNSNKFKFLSFEDFINLSSFTTISGKTYQDVFEFQSFAYDSQNMLQSTRLYFSEKEGFIQINFPEGYILSKP